MCKLFLYSIYLQNRFLCEYDTSRLICRLTFHRMIFNLQRKGRSVILFSNRHRQWPNTNERALNMRKRALKSLTQQRIMSQITSIGASDLSPIAQTWDLEIRYPALITAERKITADGDVHLRVAQRLCRLKNRGTSGNSCKKRNVLKILEDLIPNES